jgi:hypothetical protein
MVSQFCSICKCNHQHTKFLKHAGTVVTENKQLFEEFFKIKFEIGDRICKEKYNSWTKRSSVPVKVQKGIKFDLPIMLIRR